MDMRVHKGQVVITITGPSFPRQSASPSTAAGRCLLQIHQQPRQQQHRGALEVQTASSNCDRSSAGFVHQYWIMPVSEFEV